MRSTVVAKLSLQMLAAPQDGGARAVNPGSLCPPQSPPSCEGDLCFGSAGCVSLCAEVGSENYSRDCERMLISLTLIMRLL